jgi:hypothetical protein
MFKLQIDGMKLQGQIKLAELEATADIEESKVLHKRAEVTLTGWKILDGLLAAYNSSVRPTVTYLFCGFYGFVKYAQYQIALIETGGATWEIIPMLWNEIDMALFSCIICYWFGSRSFKYTLDRISPVKEKNNGISG